jgi:hypothetical protein
MIGSAKELATHGEMKESDVMGILVETEARKKAA